MFGSTGDDDSGIRASDTINAVICTSNPLTCSPPSSPYIIDCEKWRQFVNSLASTCYAHTIVKFDHNHATFDESKI